MTLRELEYEVSAIMGMSDDEKWAEEEFALVRNFCEERKYQLSKDEEDFLTAIGYDHTDFSGYQAAVVGGVA